MHDIYALMKILILPEVWLLIGLGIGCLMSWVTQCPRSLRFVLCLLLVLYYGFTTHPLAEALVAPLETQYYPSPGMPAASDAIVLFVNSPIPPLHERSTIAGTDIADLLLCGLVYVKAGSAPKVVLAEGMTGIPSRHRPQTTAMQEWAVFLGYPPEVIIINDQGLATHERAREIKQLLGSAERILLIDSAIHLTRSAAAFRKAGFTVTPMPCHRYNLSTNVWSFGDFVPHVRNFQASSEAVHEYVGLLVYWLRGLI